MSTESKVESLPAAGRELDALIAEKVMGFWFEDDQWWTKHRDGRSRAYATAYLHLWGPNYRSDGLPKFSEDIAAAWEVVEKISGKFGAEAQFTIKRRTGYDGPLGEWLVGWQVWREAEGGWDWSDLLGTAEGQTAPHAICVLALKAVGP